MRPLSSTEEQAYYALTRRAFGLLAPIYELMTLPLSRVRHAVVDFASPKPGSLVLDVATGTGQQAFAFARHGCRVVGVDLTDSMLAIARKHNRAALVRFELGDATKLRFDADTFDLACISFALHDMPSGIRERVLCEMIRVTKADGTIVVVDYGLPRGKVARSLVYRLVSLYERGYYPQFIASDLHGLLQNAGVGISAERTVLAGVGRVILGHRSASRLQPRA